ncbi:glycine-rich cell wall structural protein [Drosophila guanche]|uniref:Uncharacterized protein n=1 Tax=Drosophila guanche TaxID=7266 RepID=A0A3B0K8K2_DROGU|nr:glycine-rich cell wall structural protein [Drosophila guanche]SPP81351.1 Hypothetical predicted protein [Drosophila guanche]
MRHSAAFVVLALCALALTEAAVYIGGGCYNCNPPNGQGPGIYTGGGNGGGGTPNYYNQGGGRGGGSSSGRPVYSGNFGPNGYSGGAVGRGGGGGGRGGGGGYDDGLTQVIQFK